MRFKRRGGRKRIVDGSKIVPAPERQQAPH
jgi:hypothetical protein